ncbi:hypothetical protein [Actinoalloteichus sp. GBA129-24]|uniref:hypothetical protein n=1 Tax=Actinoalloteichus sp. GBA129-24 TaxID=1612551 RepID=UPI0009505B1C|nr:hypothetical protein [Actinoalloteichus sp. GBA129-24]APU20966.1 hypothetical protein UA75_14780 [Actinoalloteichus sp. GBA129-24]APU24215.1 hypothetical protein UA75_31260 [Actinoalloteichus sp. GBA129-24]
MLKKTLRDGRTVTIVRDHRGVLAAKLADGSTLARGVLERHPRPPAPEITHRLGRLGLTTSEAAEAERLAAQPRLAPEMPLVDQREALVRRITSAIDADSDDRARAHDAGNPAGYYRGRKAQNDLAIAAAHRALGDFDRAHPEVVEQERARSAADVQRWAGC